MSLVKELLSISVRNLYLSLRQRIDSILLITSDLQNGLAFLEAAPNKEGLCFKPIACFFGLITERIQGITERS